MPEERVRTGVVAMPSAEETPARSVGQGAPAGPREEAEESAAVGPWLACLVVLPGVPRAPRLIALGTSSGVDQHTGAEVGEGWEAGWLAACRRLTPRVEAVPPRRALLDLGTCTLEEARAALEELLGWLACAGVRARAGVAPGLTLAQLAAGTATARRPLVVVPPDTAAAWLQSVPVRALPQLRAEERVTPEIVARLEGYGLRTLGHLTRVGEPALRRQFGMAGALLAAAAVGRDVGPLQPIPLPDEACARLRLGSGAPPDRVLAALAPFARRVAARLRQQGRQTRTLRVGLRWECGCTQHARLSLRQPTDDPTVLAQEVRRLVLPMLRTHGERAEGQRTEGEAAHPQALDGLQLALGDFAPALPVQATFWRTRAQQLAAAGVTAEALARQHGRPLLLQLQAARPAAIFEEQCHRLIAFSESAPASAARLGQHSRSGRDRVAARSRAALGLADPWAAVPQRLHWW
jgi:hypothetical protein